MLSAALVTDKPVAFSVISEGGLAPPTSQYVATITALNGSGRAASVEEEDRLLAVAEGL